MEMSDASSERRRLERRTNPTLAELTLPELRRMMVTTLLFVIVLVLFIWMVRTVIIASILGIIVAGYLRRLYLWLLKRIPGHGIGAFLALAILILPILALTAYSYEEIAGRAGYINEHQVDIATRIDVALHKLPFLQTANTGDAVRHYVVAASNYGTNILSGVRSALATLAIATT